MTISIDNLSKIYSGDTTALDSINLEITPGFIGLLGPNGAGKSTLMKILTTVLEKTEGQVSIFNYNLDTDKDQIRSIIGYLPQEFGLYDNLNAVEFLDYISLFYNISSRSERRQRIHYLLNQVNLFEVRRDKLKTYSGGMKRRLGIAQSLLNHPRVLIVDEPTAGLDPEERIKFRILLRDLLLEDEDRIIILSTHIVNDITALCSQVVVLNQGKILFQGDIESLERKVIGKVWEYTADYDEMKIIEENKSVINSIINGIDGHKVRFLSEERYLEAVSVDPTLEDAYLYLIKQENVNLTPDYRKEENL